MCFRKNLKLTLCLNFSILSNDRCLKKYLNRKLTVGHQMFGHLRESATSTLARGGRRVCLLTLSNDAAKRMIEGNGSAKKQEFKVSIFNSRDSESD